MQVLLDLSRNDESLTWTFHAPPQLAGGPTWIPTFDKKGLKMQYFI